MPFSCFLFRPRKRLEKRRKRSHTNVSSTLSTRSSTPPAQTAHICFHRRKWVHTRLCQQDRTQGHTQRNRWRFGWGWYHYPRSVPHVSETLRGRSLKRQTLPLLGLGRGCSRRRRGPAGLRDLFRFCRNCGLYALFQILLSVLQTLQLVPFLCKLRLSSFLFGSEFNGFRSKQAGFFAIILENV